MGRLWPWNGMDLELELKASFLFFSHGDSKGDTGFWTWQCFCGVMHLLQS